MQGYLTDPERAGLRFPSVTEIIGEWVTVGGKMYNVFTCAIVDRNVMAFGAGRGSVVHRALPYIIAGTLDWSAVAPELMHQLRQADKFLKDTGFRPLLVEKRLENADEGFCGKPDMIGTMTRHPDGIVVVDAKTGDSRLSVVQLKKYEDLYRHNYKYFGKIYLYVLELRRDKVYKLVPKRATRKESNFFKSCLDRHNYMKGV